MPEKIFHDPQHGWVAGSQHSIPPRKAILKVFHSVMGEGSFDNDQLPLVPVVTSVVLRQQNRRRWKPDSLVHMLARFPRLQEIHYEPWREWDSMQKFTDRSFLRLFEFIQAFNKTLKKVVVFENFNQQYPWTMQLFLNGVDLSGCDQIRNPIPAVGRMVALASLRLEHLAASFIVDASDFFHVEPAWKWPSLSSLVLTSRHLTTNEDPVEIGALLQTAAAAAMKMPQLEAMEIWNGRKGVAALFRYQTSWKYRQATITWRGTWRLTMDQSVIQAWEAVLYQWGSWRLKFVQEVLDEAVIKSHGDAIHYLKLSNEVIRLISLEQILFEQKAMEAREDVHEK